MSHIDRADVVTRVSLSLCAATSPERQFFERSARDPGRRRLSSVITGSIHHFFYDGYYLASYHADAFVAPMGAAVVRDMCSAWERLASRIAGDAGGDR